MLFNTHVLLAPARRPLLVCDTIRATDDFLPDTLTDVIITKGSTFKAVTTVTMFVHSIFLVTLLSLKSEIIHMF